MINPSFTYHENGQKRSEEYLLNGQFHRTDGPKTAIDVALIVELPFGLTIASTCELPRP